MKAARLEKQLVKTILFAGAMTVSLGLVGDGHAAAQKATDSLEEVPNETKYATTNEVAVMKTTAGDMVIEFWPEVAPKTVENFKNLARTNFYDGTAFHRILKRVMIQGGDPLTKNPTNAARFGTGGPGYTIRAEFNERSHQRGVLSMARGVSPNSAGSQFFICVGDASVYDRQYTAFGRVIKGDEVLERIANTPVVPNRYDLHREVSWPTKRVEIQSVKLVPADSVK